MQPEGLTLRDYFAAQALIGQLSFKRSTVGSETAWAAYKMADAMLARREKDGQLRDHEIENLTRRADKAEAQVSLLLNMNEDGQFAARAALSQIWEFLGTKDQTSAMRMLRDAFPELGHD
jgi:hypothetical protein